MAEEADVKFKEKVEALRKRWKKASDTAKGENLKVGEAKSAAQKAIITQAQKIGVSSKAWRQFMTICDHVDSAKGVFPKVKDSGDIDLTGQFARLTLTADDVLPLFEAAAKRELKQAQKAAEDAAAEKDRADTGADTGEEEGEGTRLQ